MASTPHYVQVDDIDASPTRSWNVYLQGSTSKGFAPVGATYDSNGVRTGELGFSGVFDGGGHRISNLFINRPDEDRVGLFSQLSAGTLTRVLLEDAQTTGKDSVGSLVGVNKAGVITNSRTVGEVSGRNRVGGLAGDNFGNVRSKGITGSYMVGTVIGRGDNVGGLVGYNGQSARITNCYAESTVTGNVNVGGLVGNTVGFVTSSYATGSVKGKENVGGLVGRNGYQVYNVYATGMVSGSTNIGGIAGSNHFIVLAAYATGTVNGSTRVGGVAGLNAASGYIFISYATTRILGLSLAPAGQTPEHNAAVRTLEQLRCPLRPSDGRYRCGGALTYIKTESFGTAWSMGIWYFGDAQTLPRIRHTSVPSTPLQLEAKWLSPSTLRLSWDAPELGNVNIEYQVEAPGISSMTRSTFIDVSGSDLEQLRKGEGGSNFEFSVQGSNHFGEDPRAVAMTEVPLLNVPGPPGMLAVTENNLRVLVAFDPPNNDGFGRGLRDPYFGKEVDKVELQLGYRVELYRSGESAAVQSTTRSTLSDTSRIMVDFPELMIELGVEYRVVVRFYNVVGDSPMVEGILLRYCSESDLVPDGGSGISSSPYRIATLCQLQGMASTPHYIQVADIDASPTSSWNVYPQGSSAKGFAPIGASYSSTGVRTEGPGFSGVFDGGGYRISNLFINRPDEDHVGLFSWLSAGTLRRVFLEDTQTTGRNFVGGLVGSSDFSDISNSYATGNVTGSRVVGGFAGLNTIGPIDGSYAFGNVRGVNEVGGLVGSSDSSDISNSYATGNVRGVNEVGGLVGKIYSRGSISNSYATGEVGGGAGAGGLVGEINSGGSISNSYATGEVGGGAGAGGLVGEIHSGGSISNSYATGKVTGTVNIGDLIGFIRSGSVDISNSYSNSTASTTGGTVGTVGSGAVVEGAENSSRTLVQLRCPTGPGQACDSAAGPTYSVWSESIWYFGDAKTLPVILALRAPSTPLQLGVQWPSPSTLRLVWNAPKFGNVYIEYQVEVVVLGISSMTRSTFIDVSGANLQQLRTMEGGSNFEFSVQGSNHFGEDPRAVAMTEVPLLNVPEAPGMLAVTENNLRVLVAFDPPNNDGFGRGLRDPYFGKEVDKVELQLGYRVELYRSGESAAVQSTTRSTLSDTSRIMVGFSESIKLGVEYRVVVRFYNVVGDSPTVEGILLRYCSESDLVPDGGSGISSSPYRIATYCQLQGMASTPHYIQVADIDASPTSSWNVYPQGSSAKGFAPIGASYSSTGARTEDPGFSGVFDGGGYRISNLFINRPDEDRVGLFSQLSAGTLRRVLLEDTQTTGKDLVGSLAGVSNQGLVTDSYVTEGRVSGSTRVGGLVGSNEESTIRRSYATVTVLGSVEVGGLAGSNSGGSIDSSYATGEVTGTARTGGLVGENSGDISNSYATGDVMGSTQVGGLVGENLSSINRVYATGKVMGSSEVGGLVGKNSGSIRNSYSNSTATSTGELVGFSEAGTVTESDSRTLVQLRCPREPGQEACGSPPVQTYSDWSTGIWYFGDAQTLPRIRHTSVPSTPLQLEAKWLSPSTLRLSWDAPELGNVNIEYQVEAPGISSMTRSTFIDVSGADLEQLRTMEGGSNFEFSVQGSNHFGEDPRAVAMTEVPLLNVPEAPGMLAVTENNLRVLVAFDPPNNDGFGRGLRDPYFGKEVDKVELQLGYLVELYRSGESAAEQSTRSTLSDTSGIMVDFRKPIKLGVEYRVVVRFYNAVGDSPTVESILLRYCSESDLVPDGGSGISSSPYRIATYCQLQGMASTPHYIQVADIDASPTSSWNVYPQGSSAKGFAPIGASYSSTGARTEDPGFSGVFDGGGYRISNLFINRPDEDRVGLFSQLSAGTLRRVLLEDAQTTGKDLVGSLAGVSNQGLVTDSYVTAGRVSGSTRVGGLVGSNEESTIRRSYATVTVLGSVEVGGFAGSNSGGSIDSSYATGEVTGTARTGGLVGENSGDISNSYATGGVGGAARAGGLVGAIHPGGSISNSYATGKVTGSSEVGGLVGKNSGSISISYSNSTATSTGELVGFSEAGTVTESDSRTLVQLRCPSEPGQECGSPLVQTYSGWSTGIWYFGDEEALPVIRALWAPSTPLRLGVQWPSPSTLRLVWNAPELGNVNIEYQVEVVVLGISSMTRSTFIDVSGANLQKLREKEGGSNFEFSVRGSNHFGEDPRAVAMTEVPLLNVPGPPTSLEVRDPEIEGELQASVTFGPTNNDGLGRNRQDPNFGKAVGGLELQLAYLVELYEGETTVDTKRIVLQASDASTTTLFLRLEPNLDYRVIVRAENVVGVSSPVDRLFGSPPLIEIPGAQVENLVYGASSLKHTLRASAPYASSLAWRLLTAPKQNNSTVYFTTATGSDAVVVYESLDVSGIVLSDRFTVQVTGPTGSDIIEVKVLTANATPVIVQGELTTVRISRGVVRTVVTLNTMNIHEDLTWSWVDGQSMTTARFRAQDGVEAEAGKSSQNMTVVLYVSEELNEASFKIAVIEADDSALRDEIVIRVVRQRMAGARLRFRVFLGGAVR